MKLSEILSILFLIYRGIKVSVVKCSGFLRKEDFISASGFQNPGLIRDYHEGRSWSW
jgi:hypothetical protein